MCFPVSLTTTTCYITNTLILFVLSASKSRFPFFLFLQFLRSFVLSPLFFSLEHSLSDFKFYHHYCIMTVTLLCTSWKKREGIFLAFVLVSPCSCLFSPTRRVQNFYKKKKKRSLCEKCLLSLWQSEEKRKDVFVDLFLYPSELKVWLSYHDVTIWQRFPIVCYKNRMEIPRL